MRYNKLGSTGVVGQLKVTLATIDLKLSDENLKVLADAGVFPSFNPCWMIAKGRAGRRRLLETGIAQQARLPHHRPSDSSQTALSEE